MDRNPDPATHGDPIDQRQIGLWEGENPAVQAVLDLEEAGRQDSVPMAGVPDRPDVAAGAERAFASAAHQNRLDLLIPRPIVELLIEGLAHLHGKRVEGLGPVQGDQAQGAAPLEADVSAFAQVSSRPRAMITRMISLVPSRI
jgi:hypothetical protein